MELKEEKILHKERQDYRIMRIYATFLWKVPRTIKLEGTCPELAEGFSVSGLALRHHSCLTAPELHRTSRPVKTGGKLCSCEFSINHFILKVKSFLECGLFSPSRTLWCGTPKIERSFGMSNFYPFSCIK